MLTVRQLYQARRSREEPVAPADPVCALDRYVANQDPEQHMKPVAPPPSFGKASRLIRSGDRLVVPVIDDIHPPLAAFDRLVKNATPNHDLSEPVEGHDNGKEADNN